MAFVPSKLQETFRIQCPGAEMNSELEDVYFEMRPLTRHEVSSIYEKESKITTEFQSSLKNNG